MRSNSLYLDEFFRLQDPYEMTNTVWRVAQQVAELQVRDVQMEQLSEAARDVGNAELRVRIPGSDQLRFWISPDDLYDEIGIHAHLAGFADDGTPKIWIDAETGLLHAQDADVAGTITIGAGSSAGGWSISASTISAGNITLTGGATPSITLGSATDYLTGAGIFMGLSAGAYKMHLGNPAGQYLGWNGSALSVSGQWMTGAGMNPSLQTWKTNIVFSSASATQINWTSGTVRLNDSTTYSISSGNTGTMAALTYIYIDVAVSSTVLQTTSTYSTAVGSGKILLAAAQNNTTGASVVPMGGQQPIIDGGAQIAAFSIMAGNIAAGAITAAKISVTDLAAINANLGAATINTTLTMGAGGSIRIGSVTSPTAGTGIYQDTNGIYAVVAGVQQTTLTSTGLTAGRGAVTMDENGEVFSESGAFLVFQNQTTGTYSIGFMQNAGEQGMQWGSFLAYNTPVVTNGGLESGSLTGWSTVSGSPALTATFAHAGTYSMLLPSAAKVRQSSFINISQAAGLLEVWSKVSAYGVILSAEIECYDSGGVLLGVANTNCVIGLANGEDTTKWRRFFFAGLYLPGTVKIKIALSNIGSGSLYVDDIVYRDGMGHVQAADSANLGTMFDGNMYVKHGLMVDGPGSFNGPSTFSIAPVLPTDVWTPALTFATPGNLSVAYTTQNGWYKIIEKNLVWVEGRILTSAFTHTTASGALRITGLPFSGQTGDATLRDVMQTIMRGYTKAGFTQLAAYPVGTTYLQILASGSGVTSTALAAADVPSGGIVDIYFSGLYRID